MHPRGNDADSSDSAAIEGMLLVGTQTFGGFTRHWQRRDMGRQAKASGATHHLTTPPRSLWGWLIIIEWLREACARSTQLLIHRDIQHAHLNKSSRYPRRTASAFSNNARSSPGIGRAILALTVTCDRPVPAGSSTSPLKVES